MIVFESRLIVLFLVHSESVFRFTHYNYTEMKPIIIGTHCLEMVWYECPTVFYYFCRREVEFQRDAIMDNLLSHFKK